MIKEIEKFKAIGDETRFRILRILIKANVELCACELIDILKKPQYSISKHLSLLVNLELVIEKRIGRMMFYTLNNNMFNSKLFETISYIDSISLQDIGYTELKEDFKKLEIILNNRINGICK